TRLTMVDGTEREIDVVVAADDADVPSERTILALGEAKAGQPLRMHHLARLEAMRSALGKRAAGAKLLFFGTDFATDVVRQTERRSDIELIDLDRLYGGE